MALILRRLPALTLLILAVLGSLALPVPAAAGELPRLLVEAPESLQAEAERVRSLDPETLRPAMTLTGLEDAGPPIRVIVAAEGSPLATRMPPFVSGYAYGELGVVVLLAGRIPTYPNDSFEEVLRHEVAHVLIARAAGGGSVPRWLHEGLAVTAAGEWGWSDRTRLTVAVVRARRTSLGRLDEFFGRDESSSARAYALSVAFVRQLQRDHGRGVTARILAGLAEGQGFDAAFFDAAGEDLDAAEDRFWEQETFWVRWIPVLGSANLLWAGITLLALAAIAIRRRRNAERKRLWEEEERLAELVLEEDERQARGGEELVN